jgi:hypothetical protein
MFIILLYILYHPSTQAEMQSELPISADDIGYQQNPNGCRRFDKVRTS